MLLLDEYFNAGQEHCPTLWVGTNAGTVFIHQLTVPSSDKRSTEEVQCVLCTFYYFFSEFRLVILLYVFLKIQFWITHIAVFSLRVFQMKIEFYCIAF